MDRRLRGEERGEERTPGDDPKERTPRTPSRGYQGPRKRNLGERTPCEEYKDPKEKSLEERAPQALMERSLGERTPGEESRKEVQERPLRGRA